MINYEIIAGNEITPERIKATLEDGTELWIPLDPTNSDYQAYLNKDKPKSEAAPL